MTVGRMMGEMSSAELAEWMAFGRIEPLFLRRMDWAAALVACAAVNPWQEKPLQPGDLMPVWEDATPGQTKTLLDDVRALVVAFGGDPTGLTGAQQAPQSKRETQPREGPAGAKQGPARESVHLRDPRNDPARKQEG